MDINIVINILKISKNILLNFDFVRKKLYTNKIKFFLLYVLRFSS